MRGTEEERFRALAADVLPWLTRTATLLAADRHRGDELAHDTLVEAYVRWRKVRGDDPRDRLRRILVRRGAAAPPAPVVPDTVDVVLDRADPALGLHVLRRREALLTALAGLTPRQRAVLVLRTVEGLDVAATAEALGVPTSAVVGATHEALDAVRSRLADGTALSGGGRA